MTNKKEKNLKNQVEIKKKHVHELITKTGRITGTRIIANMSG